MKIYKFCILVLSFTLIAGCNDDDFAGDDGGVNLTTTVTFPFNDFTGVSVVGPFSVSIVPGPFSVSITVDSGLHRQLDVREEGQFLSIGFEPGSDINSEIMEITIAMPALASINLADATSSLISGFSGSTLEVQLSGAAMLEGLTVSYDLLMANLDTTSVLLMENVSPLPAVDVNLAGDSSAILNLMDNAVLTGTATGTSSLGYYGSSVSVLVFNDSSSSVTRLGPSQP